MQKILIITGASKGIGYATAAFFQQQDWKIVNISRTLCPLEDSINIQRDLTHPDLGSILADELKESIGFKSRICLVHNAASHLNDSIQNQDPVKFAQALNVALIAPAILNHILIPYMDDDSSILYLGSTLSEKAVPGAASYVVCKHASVGMMRATCQDLAGVKIHTACICPGFTDTDMLRQHISHDPVKMQQIKQKVGAERLIHPQEIAELIYFSAHNPVINGSVIHANLGQKEN